MSSYSFTVQRVTKNRVNSGTLQEQLNHIAKRSVASVRSSVQGWKITNPIITPSPIRDEMSETWVYNFAFHFRRDSKRMVDPFVSDAQFDDLKEIAERAANTKGWMLMDEPLDILEDEVVPTSDPDPEPETPLVVTPFKYEGSSEINLDPTGFFNGMINREGQIDIILSACRTALDTNFELRNHALLAGEPASGKSSLIKCFKNMVGEEWVYEIDATTSTQAGIINDIVERGPQNIKFLILNELEKGKSDDFRWLLGVMDERKELRACNSKIGNVRIPFAPLVIADCNDLEKLKGFMSGALHSRFVNRVYCPRLKDDSIYKAILPYVEMIGGDPAWINPVINYVRRKKSGDDIRTMIAYVTDGRERILTGEYFNILDHAS